MDAQSPLEDAQVGRHPRVRTCPGTVTADRPDQWQEEEHSLPSHQETKHLKEKQGEAWRSPRFSDDGSSRMATTQDV